MLSVTCAALAATLAAATTPTTVRLTTDCPDGLLLRGRDWKAAGHRIVADGRTINGLRLVHVDGVALEGATLTNTRDPRRPRAALVRQARNVTLERIVFRDAVIGLTLSETENVVVRNSEFTKVGDGINGSVNYRLLIEGNRFHGFEYAPTRCTLPSGETVEAMSRAECKAARGDFRDGFHPDAIQIWADDRRGRTGEISVVNNDINVDGQGIGTYGSRHGRATNWRVENNKVHTSRFTNIMITKTDGVLIRNNEAGRWKGSRRPGPRILTHESNDVVQCGNRLVNASGQVRSEPACKDK